MKKSGRSNLKAQVVLRTGTQAVTDEAAVGTAGSIELDINVGSHFNPNL